MKITFARLVASTALVLAFAVNAQAQDDTSSTTTDVEIAAVDTTAAEPSLPSTPPAFFGTICDMSKAGRVVLSSSASDACNGGKMPRVSKDGTRFFNTGAGAEFNALGANVSNFN